MTTSRKSRFTGVEQAIGSRYSLPRSQSVCQCPQRRPNAGYSRIPKTQRLFQFPASVAVVGERDAFDEQAKR